MKKILKSNFDYIFTIKSKNQEKLPIPSPISLTNYLKHFIDLNGEVGTADIIKLEEFLSDRDFHRVKIFVEKNKAKKSCFDLVDLFEGVEIDTNNLLNVLVSLNKRIEPRNIVQIAVSGSYVGTGENGEKMGLFSQFVYDAEERLKKSRNDSIYVQGRIHDSAFRLPSGPNTPVRILKKKFIEKIFKIFFLELFLTFFR